MRSLTPLCDTNVISELARPRPDPGVVAWATSVTTIALSVVSVEEIGFGLAWRANPRVEAWLAAFIHNSCDVLPVSEEIAAVAGQMRGRLRATGQTRTQADMLIAATARVHRLPLVTLNTNDFEDCLIPLLNPFGSGGA